MQPPPTKQRLAPEVFDLPVEKMRAGWYTDAYFNHARATLLADGRHPNVVVQVFQKKDAWLGGMDEAIAILRLCSDQPDGLTIRALYDGDRLEPWETVLTIEGDYTTFAHLETLYLGTLARRTLITTNVVRMLEAANGKPIIFMPARFDHHRVQAATATPPTSRGRSPASRSASRATSRRPGGAAVASAPCRTR
jgi:nicotinate phosphoribosyltransferase